MADTLVHRVTGQATATDVPVEISLVMTDTTMLGGAAETTEPESDPGTGGAADEPAVLDGYGPIPAELACRLIVAPGEAVPCWLRRLFVHPATGALVGMESRRRCFTAAQRRFVRLRDRTCRTPWCDAPIRHTDHVRPYQDGGPTDIDNAQGYCVACNHGKQAPGWHTTVTSTGTAGHRVLIATPTGHQYPSAVPPPPRSIPTARTRAPVERPA